MSNLDPLLERNRAFHANGAYAGLSLIPNYPVFIVTCLDPRVDPAAFLGLRLGDAPVVRNAGGRVTDEVIDDVAFISYMIGGVLTQGPLFEVAVVHHTGCGTGVLADAAFRSAFATRTGIDASVLAAEAVVDPEQTVAADVRRLLASPRVSERITVAGYVYDVDTGEVRMAVPPEPPSSGRP
jgi:carbonic anhydrase